MGETRSILLGSLINSGEAACLLAYIRAYRKMNREMATTHQIVMDWLKTTKEGQSVTTKFQRHGVVPEYGAYLFEFHLILPANK